MSDAHAWHQGPLSPFDLETTGIDVETDRIVTACVGRIDGAHKSARNWLLNPGIEIPDGAFDVHKISTEYARAHGQDAAKGVEEIAVAVAETVAAGIPLVGHNLSYDITLLDRECRRHNLRGLEDIIARPIGPVIDTRILDTHAVSRRRNPPVKEGEKKKGARTLETTAGFYQLKWEESEAHGCEYDAFQSARVAWWIGELAHRPGTDHPEWLKKDEFRRYHRFGDLAGLSLTELHEKQVGWAAEQAASLQEWFRKTDPDAVVDGSWPMRPFPVAVTS